MWGRAVRGSKAGTVCGGSRVNVTSGAGWLTSCRSSWPGMLYWAVQSAYLQKWWLQGAANMSMVV